MTQQRDRALARRSNTVTACGNSRSLSHNPGPYADLRDVIAEIKSLLGPSGSAVQAGRRLTIPLRYMTQQRARAVMRQSSNTTE